MPGRRRRRRGAYAVAASADPLSTVQPVHELGSWAKALVPEASVRVVIEASRLYPNDEEPPDPVAESSPPWSLYVKTDTPPAPGWTTMSATGSVMMVFGHR